MTKEQDKETIAATLYRIIKLTNTSYRIKKYICGVEMEDYHVDIKRDEFWCNCPGFRIQQFPKIDHKHIKIALNYQRRGEPAWAEYRMTGTGKKAQIHFVRDNRSQFGGR